MASSTSDVNGGRSIHGYAEYIVLFAHHPMYFNMRFQELESLAAMAGITDKSVLYVDPEPPTALSASPIIRIRLPSEAVAQKLCERAVLIKAVLEVWSSAETFSGCVENGLAAGELELARRRGFTAPPTTFQLRIEAFGRTMPMEEKKDIFDGMQPLFCGDEVVDLKDPQTKLWLIYEHQHHTVQKTHLGPRTGAPQRVYYCRQVAGGRSVDKKLKSGEKAYFQKYDLTQRAVLGPTTLDNELSFVMANCARVQDGHLASDPFCGTGGILVALSHFGARLTGGEIDIRVVKGWRVAYTKNKEAAEASARAQGRGSPSSSASSSPPRADGQKQVKGKGGKSGKDSKHGKAEQDGSQVSVAPNGALSMEYLECIGLQAYPPRAMAPAAAPAAAPGAGALAGIPAEQRCAGQGAGSNPGRDIFTNFMQYGHRSPEIVVCDNSTRPWRACPRGWLDCIVTDPPYGVRAASKKQGRNPDSAPVTIRDLGTYIPPKVNYGEDELASDLMNLASETLVDGGRLVFLQPVDLADFLGIDRAAVEHGASSKGPKDPKVAAAHPEALRLHEAAMPKCGRKKDPRLCISETTRDPLLLDEARYRDFIPTHRDMEIISASLQILSGGLGRLLVTMQRRARA